MRRDEGVEVPIPRLPFAESKVIRAVSLELLKLRRRPKVSTRIFAFDELPGASIRYAPPPWLTDETLTIAAPLRFCISKSRDGLAIPIPTLPFAPSMERIGGCPGFVDVEKESAFTARGIVVVELDA